MAAWLNEGRCPGGRPSVSANYKTIEASGFCIEMTTVYAICKQQNNPSSLPESAFDYFVEVEATNPTTAYQNVPQSVDCEGGGHRNPASLEQGLVMAPPKARMSNDRSTGDCRLG